MISLWIAFTLGHYLGYTMGLDAPWWGFPYFITATAAVFAEGLFYAYQVAKRMP